MPATATFILDGEEVGTGAQKSAQHRYFVTGATDANDALDAVASAAPTTFNGMPRQSRNAQTVGIDFLVSVRYSPNGVGDVSGSLPDEVYEFDTGGGEETMFVSRSTIASYGTDPPAFRGGINVTDDGPQGVSVKVPRFAFSETHYFDHSTISGGYTATLYGITGKVNSDSFRGFSAGEVLFLGARGARRGTGDWEITFSFEASPNVTGLAAGGITGIAKDGWDYLWFAYQDEVDTGSDKLVRVPRAAYVERVYARTAFSGLGI